MQIATSLLVRLSRLIWCLCFPIGSGNVSLMAKTTKTTAKRSRTTKSLLTALMKANDQNAKQRVRQFQLSDGFAQWVQDTVLPSKVMPRKVHESGDLARREWCEKNGAPVVAVYESGYCARRITTAPLNKNGWRPENALKVRLKSLAPHTTADLVAFPTAPIPTLFAKALTLDWSKGAPKRYKGADRVFLYRVGK